MELTVEELLKTKPDLEYRISDKVLISIWQKRDHCAAVAKLKDGNFVIRAVDGNCDYTAEGLNRLKESIIEAIVDRYAI